MAEEEHEVFQNLYFVLLAFILKTKYYQAVLVMPGYTSYLASVILP